MKKIELNANWFLSGAKYSNLPATVPGCVHTDLKNNGILPDYFWRKENENCQWIENEDWTYVCSFDKNFNGDKVRLVFEGLDTYSTIYLNGIELGETHNMFIPHSFDVSNVLKEKDNLLEVKFRSPIKEVEGKEEFLAAFTCERLHSRRMQCTYFWDWVDRFVTCGIFLPVYFEVGDDFNVDNVYIYTQSIDDFGAGIKLRVNFKNHTKTGVVNIEILDPDNNVVHSNTQFVSEPAITKIINIENPKLWWPNGYGEHPLYLLKITVGENVFVQQFGIRTLRVAEIPDKKQSEYDIIAQKQKAIQNKTASENGRDRTEETAGFIVIVNGKQIFCRGANWVPCEPFPSDESDEKIKDIIDLAVKSNMNMIRVWGGGLFEKDFFYDECDRRGILVTQDFLMACGWYPQKEQWFLDELKKESEFATIKLRNHPCLAWWSGDNENATHGTDMKDDYNGRNASLVGIEPQVERLDPNRRYHISSPYGGTPYMSVTRGTTHITNYLNVMYNDFLNTDCSDYKGIIEKFLSRFTVEEPVYGTPQTSSMLRFVQESDLSDPTEDVIRFHSKTNPGINPSLFDHGKIFAEKTLGTFTDDNDRLFKYQYIEYEWIRIVIENCKRNLGYNNGMLFWMLNDCWPSSMCWSIIDYYNLPKAAWYSFKRCAKGVTGSIKIENGKYILFVTSDGEKGVANFTCHTKDKMDIYSGSVKLNGYGVNKVELPCPISELIICDVEFNGQTDRTFYKDGTLPLTSCNDFTITNQTANSVTIKANKYIHSIFIEGEYVCSDNYFIMLEGEEKTVTFEKSFMSDNKPIKVSAFTLK